MSFIKLLSCHVSLERDRGVLVTERGALALGRESEAFRRHRIAFETILRLTMERARERLWP